MCDTKGDLDLDVLEGMASLVDKSLVQQEDQGQVESRFVMLETIREYALEKLETSGEKDSTKRAHAAYCLVLAEEKVGEHGGSEGAAWLETFAVEHDNFRAGLEWLTETRDLDWGLRLSAALFRFWEMREYFTEGRARLGKLLKISSSARTKARMRALFAAGVLAVDQRDYASADVLIRESLEIARQLDDAQGAAASLNALAVNARDRGELTLPTLPCSRRAWCYGENWANRRQLPVLSAIWPVSSNCRGIMPTRGPFMQSVFRSFVSLGIGQELPGR